MGDVADQYEAYPYPERDPKDEAKRLITGSPSHPLEIDHFLFAGQRDWSVPLRILVAGGGTGDALIQMSQVLTSAKRPHEILYLDLSTSSRAIAEARAAERGLTQIEFRTGSLLEAPDLGPFDYIDCCGVLHHLEDPQAGFDALGAALSDEGGLGLMVYAPYGRSGVYPLQEAFRDLLKGAPKARLAAARKIMERVPKGHPFKSNINLNDHKTGDAGFYDLLLHSQDRAYTIRDLNTALDAAGLSLVGLPHGFQYDPLPILGDPALIAGLDDISRYELAEKLNGTIRVHVAYAAKSAAGRVAQPTLSAIPHPKGTTGKALAQLTTKKGGLSLDIGYGKARLPVDPKLSRALAQIDGRRNLGEIATSSGLDPIAFMALWRPFSEAMTQFGMLYYSSLLRR